MSETDVQKTSTPNQGTEAVQVFQCEQYGDVRTATINDKPYFMLADVCRVLDIKNSRDAKTRLAGDDVGNTDILSKGVAIADILTSGGKQQATFISEGNVYRLAFTSRKPEAEKFVSWVCDEVIPAIRQQGYYLLQSTLEQDKEKLKKLRKRLKELNSAEKERREISDNYSALRNRFNDQCDDLVAARCMLDNIRAVLTVNGVLYTHQWNDIDDHVNKVILKKEGR